MKALHMAAAMGNLDVVQSLVAIGISVNQPEYGNRLPLHEAIRNNRLNVIEFLIDSGADVNAMGDGETTMLHYTVNYSNNIAIAETLIDAGASVDKADFAGVTPLHGAARCNWIDMVKLLCQNGANPEAKDIDGWTPLHKAAEAGSVSCAHYLVVEQNVLLDTFTKSDASPYGLAVKFSNSRIAELILSAGYVPCERDYKFGQEMDQFNQRVMNRNEDVHKKLLQMTKTLITSVPSLTNMCVYDIRKRLGRDILTNVNSLRLPKVLKERICLTPLELQV